MLKYVPVHWRSTLFVWDIVSHHVDTHLTLSYMNMSIVSPFDPAENENFCKGNETPLTDPSLFWYSLDSTQQEGAWSSCAL